MFQLTPPYSDDFGRWFTLSVLLLLALWSLADFTVQDFVSTLGAVAIVLMTAYFAALTLNIQRRSKRPNFDVPQHFWRVTMFSVLAACIVWFLAQHVALVAEWQGWPLLFGVLLMFCGFMSVIVGMLYKIFPFLIWLHLQNLGQGRMMSPNMKKIIAEPAMVRQMKAYFIFCALLLLPIVWPDWFVYPAGMALIVSSTLFLRNMLTALRAYRSACSKYLAAGGSAVTLSVLSTQYSFQKNCPTAKVVGLLVYILCGMMAHKHGRTKAVRAGFFVAALLAFDYIVSVALTRNPYGVFIYFFIVME